MAFKKLFYSVPNNSDRSQIKFILSFNGKPVAEFKKSFFERFKHYLPEIYFTEKQLKRHLARNKSIVFVVDYGVLIRIDNSEI